MVELQVIYLIDYCLQIHILECHRLDQDHIENILQKSKENELFNCLLNVQYTCSVLITASRWFSDKTFSISSLFNAGSFCSILKKMKILERNLNVLILEILGKTTVHNIFKIRHTSSFDFFTNDLKRFFGKISSSFFAKISKIIF